MVSEATLTSLQKYMMHSVYKLMFFFCLFFLLTLFFPFLSFFPFLTTFSEWGGGKKQSFTQVQLKS